ncbi:hypothetical protein G9P44_001465 [Scheffersomyces stipitis]|nr:hypothetical protein G9P44_001465 [Scheffersomyces stipitis]
MLTPWLGFNRTTIFTGDGGVNEDSLRSLETDPDDGGFLAMVASNAESAGDFKCATILSTNST